MLVEHTFEDQPGGMRARHLPRRVSLGRRLLSCRTAVGRRVVPVWQHRLVIERGPRAGEPVTVLRDGKPRAVRVRRADVVAYDWGWHDSGGPHVQRMFVLLDDGVQLNQPVLFPRPQQGWWYCDLVRFQDEGDLIRVEDLWIDVIVGPPDHPYRVLDLDEVKTMLTMELPQDWEMIDG
jgi:Protein of unknown function (DUF402)